MELQAQHSGQFVAHWGGEGHYQINRGSIAYAVVDLDQRTCTCRRWNLTGIPCSHSMAAIYSKRDDPTKYVDKWYFKDTYKKCYSSVLHGIRMEELWFKTNMPLLLPPKDVKQAGRPRKLRIKEIGEIPPNVLTQEHDKANDPFEWFCNVTDVLNTLRFDPDIVERIRAVQQSNQAPISKSIGSKIKKKPN
ncbi:hypothetical protein Ddye_012771 [Dipteronia dyeriana]|uniref:SWIM-type domain-containing protein n=1 Tax=Dipteronia dyeriana TaxID=168575 RepID=A0AAE0CIZ8_9ROSI|nr:hypothetical protein Ddye_012771 [Dipteronia dyeriana]